MNSFLSTIKYDYLQRTRSYAFLITMCFSLAIAYTFVPSPDATYSTIKIAGYVGFYNSAWIGYTTAMMTSVFLFLVGFYLVNSSIQNDIDTKVGHILAATQVNNFSYLSSKVLSNFLVLMTIVLAIFSMSIALFFLYNDGHPFELWQFLKPYLFICIPSIFIVANIAVIFEVLFSEKLTLQNVLFFFLFTLLLSTSFLGEDLQLLFDPFGNRIVANFLEKTIQTLLQIDEKPMMNIGYNIAESKAVKMFDFNGFKFPTLFIISRLLWILISIGFLAIVAPFFHRFNLQERIGKQKPKTVIIQPKEVKEIILSKLPKIEFDFSILPFMRTELQLLIRNGRRWLWGVNLLGMILLAVLPLNIAHQIALPVLWFLQVSRLSGLTTKEMSNNVHYFAFSAYKPLSRLLLSQVLAASLLMITLALPLLLRFVFAGHFPAMLAVILGAIFIVLLAAFLGIITQKKKLFEVLFFMLSYANINAVPGLDYFGSLAQDSSFFSILITFIISLGILNFGIRKHQLTS